MSLRVHDYRNDIADMLVTPQIRCVPSRTPLTAARDDVRLISDIVKRCQG